MRISLFAPVISPINDAGYLRALARGAEERGFHGIWLGEHVVLFISARPQCGLSTCCRLSIVTLLYTPVYGQPSPESTHF